MSVMLLNSNQVCFQSSFAVEKFPEKSTQTNRTVFIPLLPENEVQDDQESCTLNLPYLFRNNLKVTFSFRKINIITQASKKFKINVRPRQV